jgi:hypothetical protein
MSDTPAPANPETPAPVKKGCGPILVAMIALFCLTLGILAGGGGLFAFLYFTDDGVQRLNLAPAPIAQIADPVEVSAGTDNVYALAFPIEETLQIQGELDESAVRTRLSRDRFVLQQCYLAELERSPETRGELSLQFTVASNGEVIAAVSRGNYTGSERLNRCVLDKIREWTFPAPETGRVAVVRFDVLFLPFRAEGS